MGENERDAFNVRLLVTERDKERYGQSKRELARVKEVTVCKERKRQTYRQTAIWR